MTRFHDPALDLPGLRIGAPSPKTRLRNGGESASSPLTGNLPTWTIKAGGFDVLKVPTAQTDPADGRSAVFLLSSLKLNDTLGQEVSLRGAGMSLWPSDNAQGGGHGVAGGGGAGQAIAWGDTRGLSAAIVVGLNLKGTLRAWSRQMYHIAGVQDNATASRSAELADFPIVSYFPTGKWSDTTPNAIMPRWTFAPDQYVIKKNDRLDIALVVKSSQIVNTSGSDKYIVGLADIRVTLALSINLQSFSP